MGQRKVTGRMSEVSRKGKAQSLSSSLFLPRTAENRAFLSLLKLDAMGLLEATADAIVKTREFVAKYIGEDISGRSGNRPASNPVSEQ